MLGWKLWRCVYVMNSSNYRVILVFPKTFVEGFFSLSFFIFSFSSDFKIE